MINSFRRVRRTAARAGLLGSVSLARRHTEQWVDQGIVIARRQAHRSSDVAAFVAPARFSLITVNFSTSAYLRLLLASLSDVDHLDRLVRLIVVDNGSKDDAESLLTVLEGSNLPVSIVRNRVWLSHARGMRKGLAALARAERDSQNVSESNVVLFVDTDVVFLRSDTLSALSGVFESRDCAFAGQLRSGRYPYPEAQASFLAVRRDWLARHDVATWVHHGSPAYWMQRDIWRAGGVGHHFPSNTEGYVLHRGRGGVEAATSHHPLSSYGREWRKEPHFMGVPGGAAMWAAAEERYRDLTAAGQEERLVKKLRDRWTGGGAV